VAKDFGAAGPKAQTQPAVDQPAAPILPTVVGGDMARSGPTISAEQARPFILIFSGKYHSTPKGPRPTLFPQVLKGGIAGVRAVLDKRTGIVGYDVAGLMSDLADAGKTGLPLTLGYCVQEPGMPNIYRPAWGRVVKDRIVQDPEAYDAQLVAWMESGVLPKPTAEDLDDLRDRDARALGQTTEQAMERFRQSAAATVAA
jgi:hypothetical protein